MTTVNGNLDRAGVRKFIDDALIAMWRVMTATGNGYHRQSLRNTGVGKDRRNDKLTDGLTKTQRSYKNRYASGPYSGLKFKSARQHRREEHA
jgi:hypothetical protein